jgi:hypothetical protein
VRLVIATVRTLPPLATVVVVGGMLPVVVTSARGGTDLTTALSASTVLIGAVLAFAVDDPAAPTTTAMPVALPVQRARRAGLLGAVLLLTWSATLLVAALADDDPVSAWALAPQLAAAAALAVALAAGARTDAPVHAGIGGTMGALLAMLLIGALGMRITWMPVLGSDAHPHRWWWIAAAAGAAAVWQCRDPAARSRRRGGFRLTTARPGPRPQPSAAGRRPWPGG